MEENKREKCQVFQVSDLIGKKWTIPLLQEINCQKEKGFNFFFKRMAKISPKILSQRLKDLEKSGLITKRKVNDSVKIITQYTISNKGIELLKIVDYLRRWNEKYNGKEHCTTTKCVECELY